MTRYSGVCVGGPWDGQRVVHDAPWFRRNEWPGPELIYVDPNKAPEITTVRVHAYNFDYMTGVWRYVAD